VVTALLALGTGCVPADPPTGAKRRPGESARSTQGPRLAAASATPRSPTLARVVATQDPQALPPRGATSAAELPVLRTPFRDDFARQGLGSAYRSTSNAWRIEDGELCVQGARNRPLWLVPRLPPNARIEFDAESASDDGDIKVEAWGDGLSFPTTVSYNNATGYVFVLGGWKNSLHVLARLDEHGRDRSELRIDLDGTDPRTAPVEPGRAYHVVIERRDARTVRLSVDDVEILTLDDPSPLMGKGHEHFAFNDWETRVCFDNLDIVPLEG
jgi:hypothetical protein